MNYESKHNSIFIKMAYFNHTIWRIIQSHRLYYILYYKLNNIPLALSFNFSHANLELLPFLHIMNISLLGFS